MLRHRRLRPPARQPTNLLNRWIVPLESRIDYLKLHTGKSFSIPFEELVIFSTNLEPEDLMDPAFLRRLPYKIEIGAPSVDQSTEIFDKECRPTESRSLRKHSKTSSTKSSGRSRLSWPRINLAS